MKDKLIKSALVLCAVGMLGGGILLQQRHLRKTAEDARAEKRRRQQARLLDALRREPLFLVEDSILTTHQPEVVRRSVHAAEEVGLDLFQAYLDAAGDEALRASLAYMLIVQPSEAYLAHVEEEIEDVSAREVLLWIKLAGGEPTPLLPHRRRRRLARLAAKSPTPPGVWYRARRYHENGLLEDAAGLWRQLLEARTPQGVDAARNLLAEGRHAPRARAYLWEVVEHSRGALRQDAVSALTRAAGGAQWPEYRRYRIDSGEENLARLLKRLRGALPDDAASPAEAG